MPASNNRYQGRRLRSSAKAPIRSTTARTSSARSMGSNRQSTPRRGTGRLQRRNPAAKRGAAVKGAQNQLKRFRQGSILAVALTGFLLLMFSPDEAGYAQDDTTATDTTVAQSAQREDIPDTVSIIENIATEDLLSAQEADEEEEVIDEDLGRAAKNEALSTLNALWNSFYANLPKMVVAVLALVLAWLFARLMRLILRKTIGHWSSSQGIISLVGICIWLFAIGIALSVVAGDIRALVGSLGLIGLALSWSLQTPIESFTGWLLNSFRGYYRVGDRISVGDVFGDVYKIDFLTTTVWEIGAPYRQGFVQAEQPTGRLVTFPNNEILSGMVVNLTGDFPYVWDELAMAVANESDIRLAMEVMEKVATNLLGDYMKEPAQKYHRTLQRAGLHAAVPEKPQVFISIEESWTDVVIRYLVGARERRKWKSELSIRLIEELNKPEYISRIIPVYPRQQLQFINPDGIPVKTSEFSDRNIRH